MKKVLVILFVILCSTAFAQNRGSLHNDRRDGRNDWEAQDSGLGVLDTELGEFTVTGGVRAGLEMNQTDIREYETDSGSDQVRFGLGGNFKRKNMYIEAGFYATQQRVWFDRAWGWFGLYDNKIKINLGKIDKSWGSGGQADESVGGNSLLMVEFLPSSAWNIGFALNDPNRTAYHNETTNASGTVVNRYMNAGDWLRNVVVGAKYNANNIYAALGFRFQYGQNYIKNDAEGFDIIAGFKYSGITNLVLAIDTGVRDIGRPRVAWDTDINENTVSASYLPLHTEIGLKAEYTLNPFWFKLYTDVHIQEGKNAMRNSAQTFTTTEIGAEAKWTLVPGKVKAGLWVAGFLQNTDELRGNTTRRGWWIYTLDKDVSNTRLADRNPGCVDYTFLAIKPSLEWNPYDKLTIYIYNKIYIGKDLYTSDYVDYNNQGSHWTSAITANNRLGVDVRFSF